MKLSLLLCSVPVFLVSAFASTVGGTGVSSNVSAPYTGTLTVTTIKKQSLTIATSNNKSIFIPNYPERIDFVKRFLKEWNLEGEFLSDIDERKLENIKGLWLGVRDYLQQNEDIVKLPQREESMDSTQIFSAEMGNLAAAFVYGTGSVRAKDLEFFTVHLSQNFDNPAYFCKQAKLLHESILKRLSILEETAADQEKFKLIDFFSGIYLVMALIILLLIATAVTVFFFTRRSRRVAVEVDMEKNKEKFETVPVAEKKSEKDLKQ